MLESLATKAHSERVRIEPLLHGVEQILVLLKQTFMVFAQANGVQGTILGQLRGTHSKHIYLCSSDDKPKILGEPPDLIFDIPLDLDEQSSTDKKGFGRVTIEILDANLLVPTTLHDTRYASSVISVALIDLHLQNRLRMPRVNADNG
nr:hypothetical protein [Bradyrhizobium zhanjiangense]